MSASAVIAIAVGVAVVLGALRPSSRSPAAQTSVVLAHCPGRPAAATARRGEARPPRRSSPRRRPGKSRRRARWRGAAPPWSRQRGRPGAVDSARSRGDRRQSPHVLQPCGSHLTSAGLGVLRRWLRRVPVADGGGGFGQDVSVSKLDDILDSIRTGDGFYCASARTWITEYPSDAR